MKARMDGTHLTGHEYLATRNQLASVSRAPTERPGPSFSGLKPLVGERTRHKCATITAQDEHH